MKNLLLISMLAAFLFGCGKEEVRELKGYKFNKEIAVTKPIKTGKLSGNLTIDMYVMLHSYPKSWTSLISKMGSDKSGEFNVRIKGGEQGQFFFGDGEKAHVLNWKPKQVLPLNQWVRLTFVRDYKKKEIVLYANGKRVARKHIKGAQKAVVSEGSIYIAGIQKKWLNATIADIRIWDIPMNESQISEKGGLVKEPAKEKNLIGYWLFNTVDGKNVKSHTSSQFNLKIQRAK